MLLLLAHTSGSVEREKGKRFLDLSGSHGKRNDPLDSCCCCCCYNVHSNNIAKVAMITMITIPPLSRQSVVVGVAVVANAVAVAQFANIIIVQLVSSSMSCVFI